MRKLIRSIGLVLLICIGLSIGLTGIVAMQPGGSARMAVEIRRVVGPKPVTWMETVVFTVQDWYRQTLFGTGIEQASAPWSTSTPVSVQQVTYTPSPLPKMTETPRPSVTPEEFQTPEPPLTPAPSPTPEDFSTPEIPALFALEPLTGKGGLAEEGIWEPYLLDPFGRPIALRTFLQPDPKRAYAVLSVVAFDLRAVRLHFILGNTEPRTGKYRLSGAIPSEDRADGVLVAAFNGGFLPVHGGYGAMADGIMPMRAIDGMATVAIDRAGKVSLGAWGNTIQDSADWAAWRQNGPLIIADGQITDAGSRASIALWGGSIDGSIVTWRSALGLSRDHNVLYYAVGPAMGIDTLAEGLLTVGVDAAMQLDINASWTHFIAVRYQDGIPSAEPLLKEMYVNPGRYLKPCGRDFFYVTAR